MGKKNSSWPQKGTLDSRVPKLSTAENKKKVTMYFRDHTHANGRTVHVTELVIKEMYNISNQMLVMRPNT